MSQPQKDRQINNLFKEGVMRKRRFIKAAVCFMLLVSHSHAYSSEDRVTVTNESKRIVELEVRPIDQTHTGVFKISVFLPPNYDQSKERYRVLYVLDGFDLRPYHDAMLQEGLIHPAILVALHIRPGWRRYDWTPTVPEGSGSGRTGGLPHYIKLWTKHIKPYIDGNFRTLTDAKHTGIVGKSLSGMAAFVMAYEHPDVFGMAGLLSPFLLWDKSFLLDRLENDTHKNDTRYWFMCADKESPAMWRVVKQGAFHLKQRGWIEGDDIGFIHVYNAYHGGLSYLPQFREMFHFLLRKEKPRLLDIAITLAHGPQHQPIDLNKVGETANAYVELRYSNGLRMNAIAPQYVIGDESIVVMKDPVLGQLVPASKTGWTTLTARYGGLETTLPIKGFDPELLSSDKLDIHPMTESVKVDGDHGEWPVLSHAKVAEDSAYPKYRFAFGVRNDTLYLAFEAEGKAVNADSSVAKSKSDSGSVSEMIGLRGLLLLLDARPDPLRSLGRGQNFAEEYLLIHVSNWPDVNESKRFFYSTGNVSQNLIEDAKAAWKATETGFRFELAMPPSYLNERYQGSWKAIRFNARLRYVDGKGKEKDLFWQPEWFEDENVIGSGTFVR